jgi:hypothetical protein
MLEIFLLLVLELTDESCRQPGAGGSQTPGARSLWWQVVIVVVVVVVNKSEGFHNGP